VVALPELEVGPAPIGGTASAVVYVWNDAGNGAMLSAEAFGTGFDVVGGPWPLVGLTQVTITVTFSPETADLATGTLVLEAGAEDAGVALTGLAEPDWDGDGFDTVDAGGADCDDRNADVNPAAEEVWYDGLDQNCDGNDLDSDGDGVALTSDCDDGNDQVYPGATERIDEVDDDCDGVADESVDAGSLVLSEILVTPGGVPDLYGQFVEVYNASEADVGIGGWTLASDAASGVVSPSLVIGANEYAVLCPTIVRNEILCDASVQPWPTFQRTRDSITLVAAPGTEESNVQDSVAWNSRWRMPEGAALAFEPRWLDNAAANDHRELWCEASAAWAGTDLGSPGQANECPTP
jgi:hypothetical protein